MKADLFQLIVWKIHSISLGSLISLVSDETGDRQWQSMQVNDHIVNQETEKEWPG